MSKLHVTTLLLSTALVAGAATAQTGQPAPSQAPPAGAPSMQAPASPSPSAPSGQFVTQQSANQWRALKLVGITVYGPENERIGDINEVLIDKNGTAEAVVIGVGGFLGVGEKNVAVPFKSLEWMSEPRPTVSTDAPTATAPPGPRRPGRPLRPIPQRPRRAAATRIAPFCA
jgi:hypothetical protein